MLLLIGKVVLEVAGSRLGWLGRGKVPGKIGGPVCTRSQDRRRTFLIPGISDTLGHGCLSSASCFGIFEDVGET
jgi:hypothetical protein